jgi:hypothetical protein
MDIGKVDIRSSGRIPTGKTQRDAARGTEKA